MGFRGMFLLSLINLFLGQTACDFFSFPSFNKSLNDLFIFSNANTAFEALQVTQETLNRDPKYSMANRSGRVIYNKAYNFWREDGAAVSFNTTFVLNMQVQTGTGGEGIAFIITSNKNVKDTPEKSYGLWMGLFNSSTNGLNGNQMVAVEFDTRENSGTNDPDGNHIGININSINSTKITSLDRSKIDLKSGNDITVWIKFNGVQRQLQVYMANGSSAIPLQPLLSVTLVLTGVLGSEVHFGFTASTGDDVQLNCVKSWSMWVEPVTSIHKRALKIALLAIGSALFIAALVAIFLICRNHRKSQIEAEEVAGTIQNLPGHLREFKFKDLKKATKNFSTDSQLGRGAFGSVHKAVLPKDNITVAVKRMLKDSKQVKGEFISEISIINQLRHRNLVPLLGWCHEKGQLMMVYEYMPNRSLEKHIYKGLLNWDQRYNIISGVASALLYLHEEWEKRVIHRDLKPSNIMLDSNYDARLGDFGLARLLEHNRTSNKPTNVAGTMGYIAPECFHTGRATVQSDVFGFGTVVLEVVSGRPAHCGGEEQDLVGWVWGLHRENKVMEAADCRVSLAGAVAVSEDDIKGLLMIGLACSNPNPGERPAIRHVKQMLLREMPLPFVPPFRPSFVWPYPRSEDSCKSSIVSLSTENISTETSFLQSPAVR